jgi:hypothetical protein
MTTFKLNILGTDYNVTNQNVSLLKRNGYTQMLDLGTIKILVSDDDNEMLALLASGFDKV